MNPFQDFKPEIKTFLLVALIAVIISVGGILLLRGSVPESVVQAPSVAPDEQTLCKRTGGTWNFCPENPSPNMGLCISCQCPAGFRWLPLQGCKRLSAELDTSTPAPSEVEGWQTYRNDEFGFEVKYPQALRVESFGMPSTGLKSFLGQSALAAEWGNFFQYRKTLLRLRFFEEGYPSHRGVDGAPLGVFVEVFKAKGNKGQAIESLEAIEKQYMDYFGNYYPYREQSPDVIEITNSLLDNTEALRILWIYFDGGDASAIYDEEILAFKNRLFFAVSYLGGKSYKDYFNQILSTFRFIE